MQLEGLTTDTEAIVTTVLGAVLGGAGIVGIVFAYIRRFIDKRLKDREDETERRLKTRIERKTVEDEWFHSAGRLLFHLNKAVETGTHNGDLRSAYEKFELAEEKKKQLDRRILVESEEGL